MIPPPASLGLPSHFKSYRPQQVDAILDVAGSAERVVGLDMPTGSGKTLVYITLALLLEVKTVVLVATKGLMEQIERDFRGLVVLVKGQNNYVCELEAREDRTTRVMVDEGICHAGVFCPLKQGGCHYYDAVRKAVKTRKPVITNYSFWMHAHEYGEGLGKVKMLVLDEAHEAPDQLADFLTVRVGDRDMTWLGGRPPSDETEHMAKWLGDALSKVNARLLAFKTRKTRNAGREIKHLNRLKEGLSRLFLSRGWLRDKEYSDGPGMRWDPIWPAPYAESKLLREIPKILAVSATITPKTLDLLGLQGQYMFGSYKSTFPASRRPVVHVATLQMNWKVDEYTMRIWLDRIDQIVGKRLDRKGIIHTVSYSRAQYILANSRHRAMMLGHDSRTARAAVERFRTDPRVRILVSPSLGTGYDFPHDECRYQIIAKVPFPDARSALLKARGKADKQYHNYLAMTTLVQSVGRGMRAADDWCETLVIDDNFEWFVYKHKKFAPKWFLEAVRSAQSVPPPMTA